MNALFGALKDFITRDFMYLVGGGTIIFSFLWAFHPLDLNQIPAAAYIFGAGLAYGIGYVVQDFLSLIPLVTTRRIVEPCPLFVRLYLRFTGEDRWIKADINKLKAAEECLQEPGNDRVWTAYQRTVSLKHVGTALGSSSFVSSVILVYHAIVANPPVGATSAVVAAHKLNWPLAVGAVLLTIAAVVVGWLKAAQQSQFLAARAPKKPKKDGGDR